MKVIKTEIPIYFGYLRIVLTRNFNKAAKKLKCKTHLNLSDYGAFVYPSKDKKGLTIYTVVLNPKPSHTVIAHEVVHVVNAIYEDRGMSLQVKDDEHQAYLTGWVTQQIYNSIKK